MAHATTSVNAGLARALRRRLRVLAKELPRARRGDVRSVHRARVATRRLREALSVLEIGARGLARSVRRDLRRVTTALGGVREMDVALLLLQQEASRRGWPPPAVTAVTARCDATRDRQRKQLTDALERADMGQIVGAIDQVITGLEARSRRPGRASTLASRLRKRAREFQRAVAAAGTLYAPAPLHATRLAAKKLRYTLELAHEAARVPVTQDLKQLESLQSLLGELHDFQIVQEQTQMIIAEGNRDRTSVRDLETLDAEIERSCRELHAKFLALVPRLTRLADRVSGDVTLRLVKNARGPMAKMAALRVSRPARASAAGAH
jgi:CHAD domain-containing protein